ncbi:MAG: hypothetical protein AB7P07_01530 [Hyphomonadaceae bacterium]
MRLLASLTLPAALLCLACAPPSSEAPSAEQAVVEGCAAAAEAAWSGLQVQASSEGAACGDAQATLSITDNGRALLQQTFPTAQVMTLAHVEDRDAMQTALAEWVDQTSSNKATASALPAWPEGAETPVSGEFPFYPEEGVDRAAYEAIRARNAPLFCHVQGMESEACYALENGALTRVGVQAFPG